MIAELIAKHPEYPGICGRTSSELGVMSPPRKKRASAGSPSKATKAMEEQHEVPEEEVLEEIVTEDGNGMHILEEEVVHEGELLDGGEEIIEEIIEEAEIDVDGVDEGDVPPMACEEEVEMQDGHVMEAGAGGHSAHYYHHVPIARAPRKAIHHIDTESLVALSRGPSHSRQTVRQFLSQTMPMQMKGDRRSRVSQRDDEHVVIVDDLDEELAPDGISLYQAGGRQLLPVAVETPPRRGPGRPRAIAQANDWREEQKRILELCEFYESLPVDKQEPFRRLLERQGEFLPPGIARGGSRMSAGAGSTGKARMTRSVVRGGVRGGMLSPSSSMMAQQTGRYSIRDQPASPPHVAGARFVMKRDKMDATQLDGMPKLEHEKADASGGDEIVDVEGVDDMGSRQHKKQSGGVDLEGDELFEDESVVVEGEEEEEEVIDEDDIPVLMQQAHEARRAYEMQRTFVIPELRDEVFAAQNETMPHHIMMNKKPNDEMRYCPSCEMVIRRSMFYHHQRLIRQHGSCQAFTPKRFPCDDDGCGEYLPTIEKLCYHMKERHDRPTEVKEVICETEHDFQRLLAEIEGKGGNFRMSRGNKNSKEGVIRYYRCNRIFRPADMSQEGFAEKLVEKRMTRDELAAVGKKRRGAGTIRTEQVCSAFYRKNDMPDGRIHVRYCDHHLHTDERLKLPDIVRNRVAEMLHKGLPVPVIANIIRSEASDLCQPGTAIERRVLSMTERDVRNVMSCLSSVRRQEKRKSVMGIRSARAASDASQVSVRGGAGFSGGRGSGGGGGMLEDDPAGLHLSHIELAMLEQYEHNAGIQLSDEQAKRREEDRARCRTRAAADRMGGIANHIHEMVLTDAQLSQIDELTAEIAEVVGIASTSMNALVAAADQQRQQQPPTDAPPPLTVEKTEKEQEEERAGVEGEVDTSGGVVKGGEETPKKAADVVMATPGEGALTRSGLKRPLPLSTGRRGPGRPRKNPALSPHPTASSSAASTPAATPTQFVDSTDLFEADGDAPPPQATPTKGVVTRTGRVSKPTMKMEME